MPRRPRQEDPTGGMYHVYARGNDRMAIFRDDGDRVLYLRFLGEAVKRMGWSCLAYCLMTNHVHLIVETHGRTLGDGMRIVQGRYAQVFNRRHGRVGHLWQRPYGHTVIEDDGHLAMTARYVALNPVEAGLCADPCTHEWSSAGNALAGTAPDWLDVQRLLACFAWLGGDPLERYAELVSVPGDKLPAEAPQRRRRRPVGV